MSVSILRNWTPGSFHLRGKLLFLYGVSTVLMLAAAAVGFWRLNDSLGAFAGAADARQAMLLSIVLLIAAAAAGALLFMLAIQRGIAGPLTRLSEAMHEMASGNLSISVAGADRGDEIGAMTKALHETAERFGATIAHIKIAAGEVTDASAEISSSTTDLSQRTEEQAASLEETSASMEEISATVKKNAENAPPGQPVRDRNQRRGRARRRRGRRGGRARWRASRNPRGRSPTSSA